MNNKKEQMFANHISRYITFNLGVIMNQSILLAICMLVLFATGCTSGSKASKNESGDFTLSFTIDVDEKEFIADLKEKLATFKDEKKQDYLQSKFQEAIDRNFRASILSMMEEGIDINSNFFLENAVSQGKVLFLDLYLNINTDHDRSVLYKALCCAVEANNLECVKLLLNAGLDLNPSNMNAFDALPQIGSIRDDRIIKLMLENGLDPNVYDSFSLKKFQDSIVYEGSSAHNYGGMIAPMPQLPLIFRAQTLNILKLLIKYGADLNVTGKYGQTLLHDAIINNEWQKMEILIKSGADVDAKDQNDDTPLILYFKTGFPSIKGGVLAHYNRKSDDGIYECHEKGESYYSIGGTVKALIFKGANVNYKNKDGMTALHYAALRMDVLGIKLLTKYLGDINAQDNKGNTPLHIAAMHNHDEYYIKQIIDCGARVNIANNKGDTPLDILKRKHGRIISLLKTESDRPIETM